MPAELTFAAALLVGLLGSSHCLGMCGGIVAAFNLGLIRGPGRPAYSVLALQLSYHLGRIGSYVLVGLAAGELGAGLRQLGLSPVAGKLIAAGFMIALGLYLAGWWRGLAVLERQGARLWRQLQPLGRYLFPIETPPRAFLLGTLWGWLPCGLVYSVVAWSLTTAKAGDGALLMLGFGLGTLPAMLIAGRLFNHFCSLASAPSVRAAVGITVIAFGLYSGINGLLQSAHAHRHMAAAATLQQDGVASTRTPAILPSAS